MALDPELQQSIQTAINNLEQVSKTILARQDLSDVEPGKAAVPLAMVLEKELNAVLVAAQMTPSMATRIENSIAAISPGLAELHISEAKMSAKTGQLNRSKKVSTSVSTAFSALLKETLTSLNVVDTLIKVQPSIPSKPVQPQSGAGDYRKAIRAEFEKLNTGVTKITIKNVVRAG